ncbi:phosphoglycerate kinase [Candidatus Saccharibacteria bacterium 32-50-13]|nr:MAG: phosphoglycerate kinase [Candidatus Saccharibacteria bacterium 32-50-13]
MTFFKKTLRDVPLDGKTVLVRADYNVPLTSDGKISDDLRIRASLPTLRYLLDRGCKVVIVSHLGRPEGARNAAYSLQPVADRLATLLDREVRLADDCVGDRAYQTAKKATPNVIVLFENLRFHAEEEANDEDFAGAIAKASGAQYLVQDGFGVVHRAHASTEAITHFLPSVAGLLLETEYTMLTKSVESPKRPLVTILGGAKVSDKITIIERFVEKADTLLIGGAMANTFLEYQGESIGASKYEPNQHEVLDQIYAAARAKAGEDEVDNFILVPSDVAVARHISEDESRRVVSSDAIAADDIALDIGDRTIERYVKMLEGAGTVIWNGPVGYSELDNFAHGSARIALALATHPNVTSIVGGGDTADFVLKWDGHGGKSFTHVSTGGGAGLELMAGKKLPGVEALLDANR